IRVVSFASSICRAGERRQEGSVRQAVLTTIRRVLVAAVAVLSAPALALAQGETIEYYALDAIGSVRVVFDPGGTVLTRLDYAPFGRELTPASNAPDRKFAALFRDGEAGLDYAEARSYHVRTGRFSSPDPIYGGLFESKRWNRYAYALTKPGVFVDSSGLLPTEVCRIGRQEDYKPSYACIAFLSGMGLGGRYFWPLPGRGSPQGRIPRDDTRNPQPPPSPDDPPQAPPPREPPPPSDPAPDSTNPGWHTPFWGGCGDNSSWYGRAKENFVLTNSAPGMILPSGLGVGLRVGETVKTAVGIRVASPQGVLTQGAELARSPSLVVQGARLLAARSVVLFGVGGAYLSGVAVGSGIRAGLFCN
ncbi:MAG: RHS repeat domain-containing protein, partial [Vicinamibacterales bacterium]